MWMEVLVEGASDVPAVTEILTRRFGLRAGEHFRVHPHRGKGKLPANSLARPQPKHQGLLDQLPAKLRGYAKSLTPGSLVLVVVDVDDEPCQDLLKALKQMLDSLPQKPEVLFRLAIEETESWFISDLQALELAYPARVKKSVLKGIAPDQIVGAWERLAQALGMDLREISPVSKHDWATKISPHLDLVNPPSPSLAKLIQGVEAYLDREGVT